VTNVVIIGAGSTVFAGELMSDFLSVPALESGEFRLVDIDADRLALAERFAHHLVDHSGRAWSVHASTDRTELLPGAGVVINTIEVAGLANVRHDYDIPLSYGVDQCIGDTIGPGGLFKALRTVPAWLEIVADIERLCPDALVLNYTNPMSIMIGAAARRSDVPVYGLCHSVPHTIASIAGYLDATTDRMDVEVAGINHLAWFTELRLDGQDAYPALFERAERPDIWEQDPVRFELMLHLGCFVTESSGHVSEYVPYFRTRKENLERYARPGYRGESGFYANNWPTWRADNEARLQRVLNGEEEYPIQRGVEFAASMVEALVTGEPARVYPNVPNVDPSDPSRKLIDGLPSDGVVEVAAVVDRDGVMPQRFGALPPQLAALDRRHMEFHERAVAALVEQDREAAVHALMLDPLIAAVCAPADIRRMFDEMAAAQRDHLPAFVTG
jgi:alpha-galactosidase